VWLECQTLTKAGYKVSVVCPKGPGDAKRSTLDGVELFKYRPFMATGGRASFVFEYIYSFLATLWLSARASRSGRFAVVQTCNPPDIFWPIGLAFRLFHGSRFVFDHHDLCPELFDSRFPDGSWLVRRCLVFLERRTFRAADQVISTNDSYRSVAMERGNLPGHRVTVVRTGPDAARLRRGAPDPALRRGRAYLVAYIGVMGPQDGVDIVLRVADVVVNRLGRKDIAFTLIGGGDCFDELIELRAELGLEDVVELTGRIPDHLVSEILSTADLGICPDPKNPLNDVSTMNKTMEYMAFELPVVAFDLRETRVSADGAAAYAVPNDVAHLASLVVELVGDEGRRRSMGATGRERIENVLAWKHQAERYLGVYQSIAPLAAAPTPLPAAPELPHTKPTTPTPVPVGS
jgi:glycosyltransferase involved in cell wall biosynthesis